ncbi:hypothetical protein [Klenkia taihuensis]|uniref:Uncharacterized protein n=1 Tax=Klenkia taihuensis TaxID=1225127 RepID=A0A1I1V0T7_9ACTN|nr:hypothetical protein [Klenkia taihuensis]GHE14628.1 hypothetical protein GCM10011381_41980 [Klenkia taihuensis]SFD76425.1 hypothetical protein SAMN05661030_4157 [Klenkia taihuensis]
MRRRLITLPAAALLAAGCTSFADDPAPSATSTTATTSATTTSPAAGLEVRDRTDLGTAESGVTAARLATDGEDRAVLLIGSPTSTVVTADSATAVRDAVPTDVVLVDGDPVAVALTADPVATDPVLALVPVEGSTAGPLELDPQTTAPRGIPVLAAAGDDEVMLLVEDTDRTGARVLAVDPSTGEVREDVDLDLGEDVASVDLLGLAATSDGVVAGVGVRGSDGTTTGRLVTLDADLQPDGDPQDTDGELLALTADGTPVTADEDGSVRVDGDEVAADLGTRVSGAAVVDGTPVVALRDQGSPTVVVGDEPVALCDGDGDALAVGATGDGGVLVAGTCDGDAVLWTLG